MKELIVKILQKALEESGIKIKPDEILGMLEIPPSIDMGDYAFPCFALASQLKKNPHEIALEVRANIGEAPLNFEDIQTKGAYINFFINRKEFARKAIKEILNKKENFGKNQEGKGHRTMIEFSQPNTHKAFHVGHVRGTSFGESLARISEFSGEKTIRANYSGDTGMHVAKWIWCYKKYHSKEKLKNDEIWIASIYVDAVKRLGKNKNLQKEVDEINLKLENKEDKELSKLWEKTRKLSIDSWKKIYEQLNTKFDIYFFESEMEKRAKEISSELLAKKIAKKSDDAIIMNLKKCNLGVWVLIRKDGTVLYSAKDLALAEKKFAKFKIDKNIMIVGSEQSLHIAQLFKTLELMNFGKDKRNIFISFSEVRLPTGKMSSRTGENVLYSYFMNEISNYAKDEIKKRGEKISDKELNKRAMAISIAAMKYSMLRHHSNKNIIFNKEEALNFEGDTGPYLLYSYARANSILKKSKTKSDSFTIKSLEEKEIELTKKLSQFPEIISNSYRNLNPSLIANYSFQLAQIFNEFYHSCPVLKSENKSFRISLVKSFICVLGNCLYLMGIETIEKM